MSSVLWQYIHRGANHQGASYSSSVPYHPKFLGLGGHGPWPLLAKPLNISYNDSSYRDRGWVGETEVSQCVIYC